jgi:hypothetical protein
MMQEFQAQHDPEQLDVTLAASANFVSRLATAK